MRYAFTLIEIIFVLIIMGIVASIGSDLLFKAYENYLVSFQFSTTSYKTEAALEQMARRLEYRIPYSAISIHDISDPDTMAPLSQVNPDHKIIAWIGQAYEAKRGEFNGSINYPGWSGFADLSQSDKSQLKTKGDDLNIAAKIIKSVYSADLSQANNGCALTFNAYPENVDILQAYGWKKPTGTDPTDIFAVHAQDSTTLLYDDIKPKRIYEHFTIGCSAYAIVPKQNAQGNYDLYLYYNFRPWKGERFSDGKSQLLVQNVTKFNFRRVAHTIELKLCTNSVVSSDINVTICGKKVIF